MAKNEIFKLYLESFPIDVAKAISNVTSISQDDIKFDYSFDSQHNEDIMCLFPCDEKLKSVKAYSDERSIITILIAEDLYMGLNISYYHDKSKNYHNSEKRRKLNLEFRGISIQFFHKDILICKAEWSNDYTDDKNKLHPQPHWHFIKDAVDEDGSLHSEQCFEGGFDEMLEEEDIGEFDPDAFNEKKEEKDTFNILRMHFAIDSQWHKGRMQREHILPTKQNLLNWIECCVESMIIEHGFRL